MSPYFLEGAKYPQEKLSQVLNSWGAKNYVFGNGSTVWAEYEWINYNFRVARPTPDLLVLAPRHLLVSW